MHPPIYILSGLGADARVFEEVDFGGHTVHHLPWLPPKGSETLQAYAARMAAGITHPAPILIGISFGGVVAQEICALRRVERFILISSLTSREELPLPYRIAGRMQLHRIVPTSLLLWPNALAYWFFGVVAVPHKRKLAAILRDTHPGFLRWALHLMVQWQPPVHHTPVFRIHGTRDRILPYYSASAEIIKGGGHLIPLTHPSELSRLLQTCLR